MKIQGPAAEVLEPRLPEGKGLPAGTSVKAFQRQTVKALKCSRLNLRMIILIRILILIIVIIIIIIKIIIIMIIIIIVIIIIIIIIIIIYHESPRREQRKSR